MSGPTNTTDLGAAIAGVSEFPERLGPVLIKELRQGLRSGLFVLPFVILPTVLALVAVWALANDNITNAREGVQTFVWISVLVPVLLLTPLRALGAIRSEREAQTLDLLQLTPLTAWRIILAKWSSLEAQALLWVTALLPFFVLRYFFGGMNLTDELIALVLTVVAGSVFTALGLVVSTLPRLVFWLSLAGMVFLGLWLFGILLFGRMSVFRALGSGSSPSPLTSTLMVLMAAHLTYIALAFAGSRIAPLADNFALRLRGATLGLFAWFGIATLVVSGPGDDVRWLFFAIAAIATTFFTTIDLTTVRSPLLVHVRPWARFGPLGVTVGRAFLPGWPGALVFFSAMTVLATALAFAMLDPDKGAEFCAYALIFWPAVVLPRALQCFFAPQSGDRPALHLVLHLCGPLLASVLAAFSFVLGGGLLVPAAIFPSALWWLGTFEGVNVQAQILTVAVIGACWILVLTAVFYRHSRDYWATMARHVATARGAKV